MKKIFFIIILLLVLGGILFFLFKSRDTTNLSVGLQYPMVQNGNYTSTSKLLPPGEIQSVKKLITEKDNEFYCGDIKGVSYEYSTRELSLAKQIFNTVSRAMGLYSYNEYVIDCGSEYFVYVLRNGKEFYGPFEK